MAGKYWVSVDGQELDWYTTMADAVANLGALVANEETVLCKVAMVVEIRFLDESEEL
jgi:hypothetical protein